MVNDAGGSQGMPVLSVFREMEREFRDQVVGRALAHLDVVKGDRRNDFLALVRENVRGVRGFQDASKAPITLLRQRVSQEVMIANELAAGVLGLWLESHDRLESLVETHLESAEFPVGHLDLAEHQFRGVWLAAVHRREKQRFGQQHPEFDENDIGLMLCCVSGNAPVDTLDDGSSGPGHFSPPLAEALKYLRTLSVVAPEWDEEVPDFVRLVNQVRESNEVERSQVARLEGELSGIRSGFADLLEFFECSAEAWSAANLLPGSGVGAVSMLVSTLESLLIEYQAVHLPAAVMSEERERAGVRVDLQGRILETLAAIGLAMKLGGEAPDEAAGPLSEEAPLPLTVVAPTGGPAEPERANHSPEPQPAVQAVLQEEFDSVQSIAQDLKQHNEHLEEEVKKLEGRLYESQQQEESWRIAYVTYDESQKGIEDDIEADALGMDHVAKAVALAAQRFAGRLIFQLNSESDVDDNPYERPGQVWKALQWLATIYYDSRAGEVTVTDFDLSIRRACGWWYKSSQGQTTLSTYRNSYTTKYLGKSYLLEEHIGRGTNRDARYTIRIAFDWDRDLKAVAVGYIGRHQRTDIS